MQIYEDSQFDFSTLGGKLGGPNDNLLSMLIHAKDFISKLIAVLGHQRPLGVYHVFQPRRSYKLQCYTGACKPRAVGNG